MRLPKESNKSKGYGYVEFEDRQSLIDALSIVDTVSYKIKSLKYKYIVSIFIIFPLLPNDYLLTDLCNPFNYFILNFY
jgi:RNA recognition motif-containing protein